MNELELGIKELADLFDISTRTIRYYEEKGLLQSTRKENNYRVYDLNSLNRLEMIVCLKRSGLSLDSIQSILSHSVDTKEMFIQQKEELDKQIMRLKQSQNFISHQLALMALVETHGIENVIIERKPFFQRIFLEAWHQPKNGVFVDENESIEVAICPNDKQIIGVYQTTSKATTKKVASYYFYQNGLPISYYVEDFVQKLEKMNEKCLGYIYVNSNNAIGKEVMCQFTSELEEML